MNESLRRGERGVSILGALVVALMLGAGSVATFELASPSLSSVADESQLATSHIPKPKAAPQKTGEEDPFAKQQEKACKQRIKSSAAKGAADNIDTITITKEKGKDAESSDKDIGKRAESDGTEAVVDLCISVRLKQGANPNKESSYECKGRLAKVSVDSRGAVTSRSSPYFVSDKGQCRTITCKQVPPRPGSIRVAPTGSPRAQEQLECVVEDLPGYNPRDATKLSNDLLRFNLDKDEFETLGIGTTLNKQENDALQRALERAEEKKADADALVKRQQAHYDQALKNLADCNGCNDKGDRERIVKSEEERLAAVKKARDVSAEELKRLRDARVALGDKIPEGPPKDGVGVDDKNKNDKNNNNNSNNGNNTSGPGANTNTFPGQNQGGGLPKELQQLLGGGQPQAGNQTPKPPGTCSAGQTLCSGNTLYSRNNQCVDTPIQYCQYGCAQASGGGSSFLSFFGIGSSASSQCAPQPQQNQNCQPPPAQPNPTSCQNGAWKPTYTGACVTGWQCVPSSGSEGTPITAQLLCQPQVADVGMSVTLTYSCSSGTSEGGGFETGGAQSGSAMVTIANPPAGTNTATFGLKCTDGSKTSTKQCSVQVGRPAIVLVANPKAIPSGKTSAIGWVTSGMRSCVISSPTLQSFTDQHKNTTNVNGTVPTPPLSSPATFVLSCTTVGGATKEASTQVTIQ